MASRDMLHLKRVPEFGAWLEAQGYVLSQPKQCACEVLRAKKPGRTIIVYKRIDAKEHASVMDRDYGLVRRFIRDAKESGDD